MDADLQDSPDEIPELYRMITEDGYDLVSGYKMNRSKGDPLSKTIPTKLFNWIKRVATSHNLSYEVIFVNDGSTDRSWEVIEELQKENPDTVHGIKFRRNYG